jgi:7,8-dihydropterin-6-yl-methyl-4-(beta-D-ribofuranosyl)aminobenzene 5'-phosphate synthase
MTVSACCSTPALGGVLASNVYKLGIPIRQADAVVLSHGHFDHTGGLSEVLKQSRAIAVYIHSAAFAAKFARNADGTAREIGMPVPAQRAIGERTERPVLTEQPTQVAEGLMVTGPVPRTTDFEDTGGPFFLDRDCRRPDALVDDQSLYFDTPQGTVVLLGCAHSGVINTLRYIQGLTAGRPIYAVLGGMHLVQAPAERVALTIGELDRLDVQLLAPAHCTGMAATAALWQAFPGRCRTCYVGTQFEFDATR